METPAIRDATPTPRNTGPKMSMIGDDDSLSVISSGGAMFALLRFVMVIMRPETPRQRPRIRAQAAMPV